MSTATMLSGLTPGTPIKYNITILKPNGSERVPFNYECTLADLALDMESLNGASTFNDKEWIDMISDANAAGNSDEVTKLQTEWQKAKNEWLQGGGVTPQELLNQAIYDHIFVSEEAKRVGLTTGDSGNNPYFTMDSMQCHITTALDNGTHINVTGTTKWGSA